MSEAEVSARLIGHRYVCDEDGCDEEMTYQPKDVFTLNDGYSPAYRHVCSNGHEVHLRRTYPAHDIEVGPLATAWMHAPRSERT